jgi:phage gp45-like
MADIKLGRIKGANSDYKYFENKGIIAEDPEASSAYLQIFICPYREPSRVEQHQGQGTWCEGRDETCPHRKTVEAPAAPGHALIYLHQEEGIKLVGDNGNQIAIDNKTGSIQLHPSAKGQAEVSGTFVVKQKNDNVLLEISDKEVLIQLGGAKIRISPTGDIELSTPNQQGKVSINGNLTVQGDLKVTGKLDLSDATKQSLTEEIMQKLQR